MSMLQQCCSKPFTDMLLDALEPRVTTGHMNGPPPRPGLRAATGPQLIKHILQLNADDLPSLTLLVLFSYLDGLIQGFRKPAP
jgi:hypothetical protein